MEKLKQAKHNHLLTDWLKVGIFALLLLLPFFVFAPTAFYYGFNEHATAPTKQVENTTTIHMQQNVINGLPSSTDNWVDDSGNITFNDEYDFLSIRLSNSEENTLNTPLFNFNENDKVLVKFDENSDYDLTDLSFVINDNVFDFISFYEENDKLIFKRFETILTLDSSVENTDIICGFYLWNQSQYTNFFRVKYIQVFNLTKMFSSGNEPTIEEFNTLFPNDYYAYDSDATAEWPNGTYTTYTDISSTMSFAWESMFDTPLLKWTKNSPFKTSINGFLTLFQIPQQSGIGLYLNYLITMVCIYVVFDIVIQLFKWITHIIGEK